MLVDIVEQLRDFVHHIKDTERPFLFGKERTIEYDLKGTFHIYRNNGDPEKIDVISFDGDLMEYVSPRQELDEEKKVRPAGRGWKLIEATHMKLFELAAPSYTFNMQGSHVRVGVVEYDIPSELETLKKKAANNKNFLHYFNEGYHLL